jgi:hypothetical protein
MSLDFRITKIENYNQLYPSLEIDTHDFKGNPTKMTKWNPVTEQIVWGCMATGIGELTEKTVDEWYTRYSVWCQINGFANDLKLLPFKHVVQHIGLTTNVFPQESRTKWLKRIVNDRMDRNIHDNKYNREHNNALYDGSYKIKAKVSQEAKSV